MTASTVLRLARPEDDAGRPRSASPVIEPEPVGVAGILLAGAAVVACAANGLYALVPWHVAGLVLATALGLVLVVGRRTVPRSAAAAIVLWGAFCVWIALSITWSVGPSRTWVELDRALLYLVFTVLAVLALARPRARASALMVVGLGTGLLLAGTFAWGLVSGPADLFVLKRLQDPVGYINGVAGLALIGFWPSLAIAERTDRPPVAAAGVASAVVLLASMVLTQSRSVVPALVVSGILVLAIAPGRRRRIIVLTVIGAAGAVIAPFALDVFAEDRARPFAPVDADTARTALLVTLIVAAAAGAVWAALARWVLQDRARTNTVAAVVIAVLGVVAVIGGVAKGPAAVDRADTALSDFRSLRVDEGNSSRFTSGGGNRHELWRVALSEWKDDPVLGIGAGGYGVKWYQERRVPEAIRQPHSLPLQVLAETGVVGLLLLLGTLVAVAAAAVRVVRAAGSPTERMVVAGAIGAVASWIVHTSVDWLYNVPAVTAVALISVALLLAGGSRSTRTRPDGRSASIVRAVVVAGLTAVVAAFSVQLAAHAYADRAESEVATDPRGARDLASKAVRLDGGNVQALIALAAAEARLGSYPRSDAALARIVEAEPESYVGYALRGDLAVQAGLQSRARRFYLEASKRNPLDAELAQRARDGVPTPRTGR